MTSDGSAVMRLQRALANPRTSAAQIRAVASELPTVGLEDALAILLALLDREPQSFARTAARWGARLTIERRLPLVDAQLTFAALAVLPGAGAQAGAEALIELASRSLGVPFVSDLSACGLARSAAMLVKRAPLARCRRSSVSAMAMGLRTDGG
jgi:hypothetical protein